MKKTIFIILLFAPSLAIAEGPLFCHEDRFINQEFENVYQDLRTPKSQSTITASTITATTAAYLNASSFTAIGAWVKGCIGSTPAPTGYIGEMAFEKYSDYINVARSNYWIDKDTVTLSAGVYEVFANFQIYKNGATVTEQTMAIAKGSATTHIDNVWGRNYFLVGVASSIVTSGGVSGYIVRVEEGTTQNLYLKFSITYSGTGPPQVLWYWAARRIS